MRPPKLLPPCIMHICLINDHLPPNRIHHHRTVLEPIIMPQVHTPFDLYETASSAQFPICIFLARPGRVTHASCRFRLQFRGRQICTVSFNAYNLGIFFVLFSYNGGVVIFYGPEKSCFLTHRSFCVLRARTLGRFTV